jgi:hypothetical protein
MLAISRKGKENTLTCGSLGERPPGTASITMDVRAKAVCNSCLRAYAKEPVSTIESQM